MRHEVITGNMAAAWGARLSRAEVIPNFPITPQTEAIETLAQWVADGEYSPEFLKMDSEHSVMSAAVGASAAGSRVFTTTSSQGLLLMYEILYVASGMRCPMVMANVSRSLSAPIALWCDHDDFLSMRESGWIMIHAQDNQEVIDSVITAYKIAENKDVLLPVVVNMDGYVLSYTYEPTKIPEQAMVDRFLPRYAPTHSVLDPKKPMVLGSAVLHYDDYTHFREQIKAAHNNVPGVASKVYADWAKLTGRKYGPIETYRTSDAETVLVTQGSISTTARAAVDEMRKKGKRVGLLRLRMIRPFPKDDVAKALEDVKYVAVIDKDLSPGMGGIMYPEICYALYDLKKRPVVSNYVMGLGGAPESIKLFTEIAEQAKRGAKQYFA